MQSDISVCLLTIKRIDQHKMPVFKDHLDDLASDIFRLEGAYIEKIVDIAFEGVADIKSSK